MTIRMISPDPSEQDKHHHLHPMTNPVALLKSGPDVLTSAQGIYLYTQEGWRIPDIGSGLGNVIRKRQRPVSRDRRSKP